MTDFDAPKASISFNYKSIIIFVQPNILKQPSILL